jgi:protein disulfide-isomerase A1
MMAMWWAVVSFVVAVSASDVLVLTSKNFDETLAAHSPLLVEFYAPWCGHCKNLEPLYEKAATALKGKGLHIAKVDATEEQELAQKYEIRGFPTLKLFKNGAFVQDYQGPRTSEGIASFMEKKNGLPYTTVSSSQEVENILSKESTGVIVGYFDDLTSDSFKAFQTLADQENDIKFLVLSDAGTASGCMLSEVQLDANTALTPGAVAVLGKDGGRHLFKGDLATELIGFYYDKTYAQSFDLDPRVFSKFLPLQTVIVTAYDFKASNADSIRQFATKAAATQPSVRQMFADSNMWGRALVQMGVISGNVYPTAVAFLKAQTSHTPPIAWDEEVEFTESAFTTWLADLVAGTAVTWKKSEAVPESNDGPVKIVVHKTYDDIVLDKSKDVLVEFYSPSCPHCKNLEPVYNSLGEHFADDPNVVIAKMDGTANFVDASLDIKGFPTLKFFPAGDKVDILTYEGTRTLDDLVEFVTSNRNTKSQ